MFLANSRSRSCDYNDSIQNKLEKNNHKKLKYIMKINSK
jgi:hypothetical protein